MASDHLVLDVYKVLNSVVWPTISGDDDDEEKLGVQLKLVAV